MYFLQPETLAKAFAVLPEAQVKSLSVIYTYNVNSSLRQFVKIHERILTPLKVILQCVSTIIIDIEMNLGDGYFLADTAFKENGG